MLHQEWEERHGKKDFKLIMDINFWGVVYVTKAFLPHLLKRPEATIANRSSVNTFIPYQFTLSPCV